MTKNDIPYKKLSLNCIQHSQTRKEHILIKHVFSKKFQHIYILQGHMVEPCYIQDAQKQPLADVLQNRCSGKFYWIHWNAWVGVNFSQSCRTRLTPTQVFFDEFVEFSRTPFLQNTTSGYFWTFLTKLLLLLKGCGATFSCLVLRYWRSDFKNSFGIAGLNLMVAGDLDQFRDKIMDC